MKPAISLFSMALIAICTLSPLCLSQNVTITLQPINPPIQIPAPGGSFDYNVTVSNTGSSSQTFSAWIMVQLPSGSWYGPVLGPVNLTLPAGASVSRQRTQQVPASAPAGTYVYEGRVGIYPSTVWNNSSFTFAKTLEGSQLWVARYYNEPGFGIDEAYSLAVDGPGNVYVTGWSTGSGTSYDYATIKYNSAGVQQWVARYNGPGNDDDFARAIEVDGAGNVYVTGASWDSGTYYDYATIKYNSAGVQQWVARYNGPGNGSDYAFSLAVDGTGNVYVTGYSGGSGTFHDYATIKYDASGNQLWVTRYNGPGNDWDEAYSLDVDGAGNVYVTGQSWGSGTSRDYATIKYNSGGVQQWVARYNGPGNADDWAYSLALDGAGNVYVTGASVGSTYPNYDYATIKYDSGGVQQWVARYNGPGNGGDTAHSLAVDGAGNVYVTGGSWGSGTHSDFATIQYSSAGVQQWVSRYNGPGNYDDGAYSLAVDGAGNVYATGVSIGSETGEDYTTIKYNSAGVQQWVARYNGPGIGGDAAYSLAVDGAGNVYVTGYSSGSVTNYDYCTIKYSGGNPSGAGSNWQPVEALVFGAQEAVTEYKLNSCYPNPFNATTAISYELRAASYVSLRVYNSAGRMVITLVNGWREAGTHELTFDAGDLPSGVYFCRMEAGDFTASGKMVLLK